jgi:hypothetical protein
MDEDAVMEPATAEAQYRNILAGSEGAIARITHQPGGQAQRLFAEDDWT